MIQDLILWKNIGFLFLAISCFFYLFSNSIQQAKSFFLWACFLLWWNDYIGWASLFILYVFTSLLKSSQIGFKLNLKFVPQNITNLFIFLIGLSLLSHQFESFRSLIIFDKILLSTSSAAFALKLPTDQILLALCLAIWYLGPQRNAIRRDWVLILMAFAGLALILIPAALSSGFVEYELKHTELFYWWALHNLFVVCFAEEMFFRGFVQTKLLHYFQERSLQARNISILLSASIFALAHYKGGSAYMALAGIAGLFYSWTYAKSDRIQNSILLHFAVNSLHFLFFTYPFKV